MKNNAQNQVVENEVKNVINNTVKMNNVIDFSNVLGEKEVAQNAKVDQKVVTDLFNAFMVIPQEVIVRFSNENGYLKMIVNMNHREKFFRKYETYADGKLVETMIGAMSGKIGLLNGYNAEEHPLEATEVDPRIDLFRQFINSTLRCHFENDFIAKNGDRYICATFNISYRKQVKFCLKRTEEIESIINEVIKAA